MPAIIGGALAGAGGLASGIFSSIAGGKSASAIRYAADQARATALELDAKQRASTQPFREAGIGATNTLSNLLTGTQDIRQTTRASPFYQYLQELQDRNINRQLSARGLYGSGAGLETLQRGTTELVGQEGERLYGRLQNLANLGGNAASNQASGTVQLGSQLIGAQAQLGQAQAGFVGQQFSALGQGFSGALGTAGNLLAYAPTLNANANLANTLAGTLGTTSAPLPSIPQFNFSNFGGQ